RRRFVRLSAERCAVSSSFTTSSTPRVRRPPSRARFSSPPRQSCPVRRGRPRSGKSEARAAARS
ncbi:hypothetical protein OC835_007535, partial [Tilletia horrida]